MLSVISQLASSLYFICNLTSSHLRTLQLHISRSCNRPRSSASESRVLSLHNTPRFLGFHSTPSFFPIAKPPPPFACLFFLSILGDGKADVSAETRGSSTSFEYHTSRKRRLQLRQFAAMSSLVTGFDRVVYFQQP
jgi:hypothetical protein